MEDVLAAHAVYGFNGTETLCRCGARKWFTSSEYAAHVAQALAEAGYGSQHDAWAEGAQFAQNYDDIYPGDNPYPAPKVSES